MERCALGVELFNEETWDHLGRCLRLCGRELQIVRRVFADDKEQAIAQALGISPHTVNTYFQRLYHKLGVSSRAQLIVRVVAEYLALRPESRSGGISSWDV